MAASGYNLNDDDRNNIWRFTVFAGLKEKYPSLNAYYFVIMLDILHFIFKMVFISIIDVHTDHLLMPSIQNNF